MSKYGKNSLDHLDHLEHLEHVSLALAIVSLGRIRNNGNGWSAEEMQREADTTLVQIEQMLSEAGV